MKSTPRSASLPSAQINNTSRWPILVLLVGLLGAARLPASQAGPSSFLRKGSEIACAKGQLVDLGSHLAASSEKMRMSNCIQDGQGGWISCDCPDGYIKCEYSPDCGAAAAGAGSRQAPAGSAGSSPARSARVSSSLKAIKQTPGAHSTHSKLVRSGPGAGSGALPGTVRMGSTIYHMAGAGETRSQHADMAAAAESLGIGLEDFKEKHRRLAKMASDRTSTALFATPTPPPTTTTTTAEPTSTESREEPLEPSLDDYEPHELDELTDSPLAGWPDEPAAPAAPRQPTTSTTPSSLANNHLLSGQVIGELEVGPPSNNNNNQVSLLEGPVETKEWPVGRLDVGQPDVTSFGRAGANLDQFDSSKTSDKTRYEQPKTTHLNNDQQLQQAEEISNDAIFYLAIGAELLVIVLIFGLAAFFRYRDLKVESSMWPMSPAIVQPTC